MNEESETNMTQRVTKLFIHKTSLSFAVVFFVIGIGLTAISTVVERVMGFPFEPQTLLFPFLYAFCFYIAFVVGCFSYNFAAARWGVGITFESAEKPGE